MTNKKISDHPFVKFADDINEICAPLFKNTPINFFEPCRVYSNGEYSGFMSNKKWAEHFVYNDFQNSGIASYQRDVVSSDYTLWSISSMFSVSQKADELYKDCVAFNYGNGCTLIERNNKYTQFYYFASDSGANFANEFFINNFDLLQKFILHFNDKCQSNKLLSKAYDQRLLMKEVEIINHSPIRKTQNVELFDTMFPVKKFYITTQENKILNLSAQEMYCVKLKFLGYSSKEIGKNVRISYRTVEKHLANVKYKLNITSNHQLFDTLLKSPSIREFLLSNLADQFS